MELSISELGIEGYQDLHEAIDNLLDSLNLTPMHEAIFDSMIKPGQN